MQSSTGVSNESILLITTILSKINLIKTSINVLWNIFHKTLILSVFIQVNNFIFCQLPQPPTTHIDYLIDRCKVRLNLMRAISRSTWGASRSILLIVYKALIRSVVDYESMGYDSAAVNTKEKLNRLQGQALRICCGSLLGTARASLQVECGQPTFS